MVDAGAIAEVLNTGLQLVGPTVNTVATVVVTTLFLRKDTRKVELERIKALKFGELADALLNSGAMTYKEYYGCRNFLKIAKIADRIERERAVGDSEKDAESSANTKKEPFNFGWYLRFYEGAASITDEDLQMLWAKILAGEVAAPGKISLRTLEIVRNLTVEEAQTFNELAEKYIWGQTEDFIIGKTIELGTYESNRLYSFFESEMYKMEEIGLLASVGLNDKSAQPLILDYPGNVWIAEIVNGNPASTYALIQGDVCLLISFSQNESEPPYHMTHRLTRAGIELLNVIKPKYDKDGLVDFGIELRQTNRALSVLTVKLCTKGDCVTFAPIEPPVYIS